MKRLYGVVVALCYVLLAVSLASAGNPVEGKNSKVTLDGVSFLKYYYNVGHHDPASKSFNAFEVERIYLTGRYRPSDKLMFRVTTDVRRYDAKGGSEQPFFIVLKYGYVEIKGCVPNAVTILGQHGAPIVGFLEKQWGFRSVYNVMVDKDFGISSTYLGVGLKGKAANKRVVYAVTIANGNKWRKRESDKYKALLGRVTVIPMSGLALSGLVKVNADASPSSDYMDTWLGGTVAFQKEKFTVAGDVMLKTDKQGPGMEDVKGQGISVYGRVQAMPSVTVFGRLDIVDPNTDTDNDGYNRIIAGVARNLAKKVKAIVDVNAVTYEESGKDTDLTAEIRMEVGL